MLSDVLLWHHIVVRVEDLREVGAIAVVQPILLQAPHLVVVVVAAQIRVRLIGLRYQDITWARVHQERHRLPTNLSNF